MRTIRKIVLDALVDLVGRSKPTRIEPAFTRLCLIFFKRVILDNAPAVPPPSGDVVMTYMNLLLDCAD